MCSYQTIGDIHTSSSSSSYYFWRYEFRYEAIEQLIENESWIFTDYCTLISHFLIQSSSFEWWSILCTGIVRRVLQNECSSFLSFAKTCAKYTKTLQCVMPVLSNRLDMRNNVDYGQLFDCFGWNWMDCYVINEPEISCITNQLPTLVWPKNPLASAFNSVNHFKWSHQNTAAHFHSNSRFYGSFCFFFLLHSSWPSLW